MQDIAENQAETLRIVLIEDDDRLARLTARYLESHGVIVTIAGDGREGLAEVLRLSPDAVLLDLQLPGLDGLSVCRQLRNRTDVPILVLTARDEEADRVLGLESGADDYIVKPFSSRELLARVGPEAQRLQVGPLCLEPSTMNATLDGAPLQLTAYEFALLKALAENAGRVLGREQLMCLARGTPDQAFDRSIDVQISRLRAKLHDDPRNPSLLKTVRGVGYVLTGVRDP